MRTKSPSSSFGGSGLTGRPVLDRPVLLYPGPGSERGAVWLDRLHSLSKDIRYWQTVARNEQNVWAEAWCSELIRVVGNFEARAVRDLEFSRVASSVPGNGETSTNRKDSYGR